MYQLSLEPLLPIWLILVLITMPAVIIAVSFVRRQGQRRGKLLRAASLLSFAAVLLGPVFIHEEREPTQATLAIIVDRSPSQKQGQRMRQSDEALALLEEELAKFPQFDVRLIEVTGEGQESNETRLFASLQQALADIQPARQGGAIIISDGQVHDIPASLDELGISAPINALITGTADEYDRQIRITASPRFGLVGERVQISFRVEELGNNRTLSSQVTLLLNGIEIDSQSVMTGTTANFEFELPHAGNNIIELTVPVMEAELTAMNNRAAVVIDGIRENLKTLLVSGEPHNGLRIWRDLLKSDTGVDLIHFTILRPPEKFDNTPTEELALISFPTTELFVDKIDEFDLIILDRYQHYDILPLIYYDYIAEYVRKGGALLLATGPEYADPAVSLALTPLNSVLPASPTGAIIEQPFLPRLTTMGKRHPVSRDLEGARSEPPDWGRWLRQIDVSRVDEDVRVLLSGVDDKPLMLLGHKGEGRVGMLLSDQGWLWARGFEGGGPYANLYRRMAYWLLEQPELEEEALRARVEANRIHIERQTMLDSEIETDKGQQNRGSDFTQDPSQALSLAKITLPSGEVREQKLNQDVAGLWQGDFTSEERGLFRIENGDKTTFALIGSLDEPEFAEIVSTTTKLEPLIRASGGNVLRLSDETPTRVTLAPLQIAPEGGRARSDRIILRESRDSRLLQISTVPLYSAFLALFVTLLLLGTSWYREGH